MKDGVIKNLLGVDVGTKRVGTALCEKGTRLAVPYKCFERGGGKAERAVLGLIAEKEIGVLVVGYPLSATGEETEACVTVRSFCNRISKRSPVRIVLEDEYLSSEEAKDHPMLRRVDLRKVRKSGVLDAVSASLILERYLARGGTGSDEP